ncbi:MAG: hypothetical protein P4L65_09855 [Legionella sp.]|nr:hypothetical protein [Legionella sp.]
MEPVSIALICAAAFGTVMVIAAFVRQILLSRDKKLNDEAQSRALAQEALELEKIRIQMQNNHRFINHYNMLGDNKEAIEYLDTQIDRIFKEKAKCIEMYGQKVLIKSMAIVSSGGISAEVKAACDQLRESCELLITMYDNELKGFQEKRAAEWGNHTLLQQKILEQEAARNASLDEVYKQHSSILEKVFLRHIDAGGIFAVKGIEAGTTSFKDMLMAPINLLMAYFGRVAVVPGISLMHTKVEHVARMNVDQVEKEINSPSPEDAYQGDKDQVPEPVEVNEDSYSLSMF